MGFSVPNTLLKWISCLVLGGFIFHHYYLQHQLNHRRLAIENLKVKLLSMKNVRFETQDNTWDLLKKIRLDQKDLKQFLRTSLLSQTITLHDVQIKNGKWFLTASSPDVSSAMAFAKSLQRFVIKNIKWDLPSHSFIFQMSSST